VAGDALGKEDGRDEMAGNYGSGDGDTGRWWPLRSRRARRPGRRSEFGTHPGSASGGESSGGRRGAVSGAAPGEGAGPRDERSGAAVGRARRRFSWRCLGEHVCGRRGSGRGCQPRRRVVSGAHGGAASVRGNPGWVHRKDGGAGWLPPSPSAVALGPRGW
jgi:hypothetical protein